MTACLQTEESCATPPLSSRIVPPRELNQEELAVWQNLCLLHPHCRSPFLSPAYVTAVAETRPHVYVCVIRQGGRPAGFLPFQFRTPLHKQLGAAERVGEDMTDYFGLIAQPALRTNPQELLRLAGLTHLFFTHLDESQGLHGLTGETADPGLLIRVPADGSYWEELRGTDRKFTKDTERRQQQLEIACGAIRFQLVEEEWRKPLEHLIRCKRQQYLRTGRSDWLAVPWKRALMERLAESSSERCRGIVSTLHAGPTWVASHFGLRHDSLLHYWFPVYNPELSRYSPGRILLKAIVNAAPGAGIDTIDRGSGDSQAKREFANATHTFYRGAWYTPGVRSTAYRIACSLKWRLARSLDHA